MLLTSELVTNAVRHGQGVVTVEVDCDERAIAVAVGDDNGDQVSAPSEDPLAESGRGTTIVSAVATSWGIRAREDGVGKIVWFILLT
jgi:anti-sigma regulatory factor (Ser/Thr protein kinase)